MVQATFFLIALFAHVGLANGHACSAAYVAYGFTLKANLSTIQCAGSCTDSNCCECDSTKCCAYSCTTATKYLNRNVVGSTEGACCADDKFACSSYACPTGYTAKTDTSLKCAGTTSTDSNCKSSCCDETACSAFTCTSGSKKQKSPTGTCTATCSGTECCDDTTTCTEWAAAGGVCYSFQTAKAGSTSCTTCSTTDCCTDNTGTCYANRGTITCATDYEISPNYAASGTTNTTCCTAKATCASSVAGGTAGGAASIGIAGSVLLLVALAAA